MRLYIFLLFFLSSVSITIHSRNTSFADKTSQVCFVCENPLTYKELSLSISLSLITGKNIHMCSACRKNKKRGLFFKDTNNQSSDSPLQRDDSNYEVFEAKKSEKYSMMDIMRTFFGGLFFSIRRGSDLLGISDEDEKHISYERAPRQIIEMKEVDGQLVFVGSDGKVFSYDTKSGFDEWSFTKKKQEPLYQTIEDLASTVDSDQKKPPVPARPSRDNPPPLPPRNNKEKVEPLYEIPVIHNLDGSQSSWV